MSCSWAHTLVVPALVAAQAGCGSGGAGTAPPPAATPTPAASTVGPRSLPPTLVNLEVAQFPRPAAEACADNTAIARVAPPASIAGALASATPGTTVLVAPGTYTESPGEPTALAWSAPNVCLRADGGTVVVQAAPDQGYGIAIAGDDSVVEGFTLRGFRSSVSLSAGEGRTLRRVTLERVRVESPSGDFRDGIVAYDDNRGVAGAPATVDGLLLLGVTVDGADLGVSCNNGPCAHWWIEGSTITLRRGSGTSGADAFAIEEGRQIVVVDTTVGGAEADGIDTKADDVVVLGARVLGVARNGIKLWRGGDVIDSVLDGTGADAALVGDRPGRYRYLHVLVAHHGEPGDTQYVGTWNYDEPRGAPQLEIVNCIFFRNATGGLFVPAGAAVSIRHTIFDDGSAKLMDIGDGTTYLVSDLGAFEASGRGQANLVADPQLTDTAARDYSTRPGSPARDVAEVVNGLARDLLGGPRVIGPGPDIGPVESR